MAVWFVQTLEGDTPPALAETRRFADVGDGHPYVAYIERAAQLGITQGCGDGTNFCPDDLITRGQFAAMLVRGFDLPPAPEIDPTATEPNPDDGYFSEEISRLRATGITRGCGDGTSFCPDDSITRSQLVTFLDRGSTYQTTGEPIPAPTTTAPTETPTTTTPPASTLGAIIPPPSNRLINDTITYDRFGTDEIILPLDILTNDRCGAGCETISTTQPAIGTVTANPTNITYTLTEGETLPSNPTTVTFTYSTIKTNHDATVTLTINTKGKTLDDTANLYLRATSITGATGTTYTTDVVVAANDICPNNTCTNLQLQLGGPAVGIASTVDNRTIRYTFTLNGTPDDRTPDSVQIPYSYSDTPDQATLTINFTQADHLRSDSTFALRTGTEAVTLTLNPLANDTCQTTCAGVQIVSQPAVGTLTPSGTPPGTTFTYQLDQGTTAPPVMTFSYKTLAISSTAEYGRGRITLATTGTDTLTDDTFTVQRIGNTKTTQTLRPLNNDGCGSGCAGIQITTAATTGTATTKPDSTITYTIDPTKALATSDTFAYQTNGTSTPATATINITNIDQLNTDSAHLMRTSTEQVSLDIDVLANDACVDPTNGCTALAIATQPNVGTATLKGNQITYSLPANTTVTNPITFTYSTANARRHPGTVQVIVGAPNTDTLTNDQTIIYRSGTSKASAIINPLDNDACGARCTGMRIVAAPRHGTTTLYPSGAILYELPATSSATSDTFTYTTNAASTPANISVTITAVDALSNDTFLIPRNATEAVTQTINITANDDCVTICEGLRIITPPAVGTATLTNNGTSDGTITYSLPANTPATNPVTFTYGSGTSIATSTATTNQATVSLILANSSADTLIDDTIQVQRIGKLGTTALITPQNNDACGAGCTLAIASQPAVGTATLARDSNNAIIGITYTITDNTAVTDSTSFTYSTSGSNSATATVTINFTHSDGLTPDNPTHIYRTGTNSVTQTINVTANDNCVTTCEGLRIAYQPAVGTARVENNQIVFELPANTAVTNPIIFGYATNLTNTPTEYGTVTAYIGTQNTNTFADDAATLHLSDASSTVTINALANDACFAASGCTNLRLVTPPTTGTATPTDTTGNGTNDSFTYKIANPPNDPATLPNTITFSYTTDNATGAAGTITVTIIPTDILGADNVTIEDVFPIDQQIVPNINTNIDIDNNDTCYAGCRNLRITRHPSHGTATLNYTLDGYTLNYTLAVASLDPDNLPDTVTIIYNADDANTAGVVTIDFVYVESVQDDTFTIERTNVETITHTLDVLANDHCPEGCTGIIPVTDNLTGAVTTNGTALTYTLPANTVAPKSETFTYTLDGATKPAEVTVNFAVTQDILIDDQIRIIRSGTAAVNHIAEVLVNDSCGTSNCSGLSHASNPAVGTITPHVFGDRFVYTLPAGTPNPQNNPVFTYFTSNSYALATGARIATATISFIEPHSLSPDNITIPRGGYNEVEQEILIASNDTCEGGCTGITIVDEPSHGTVEVNQDSESVTYRLASGVTAPETITFTYVTDASYTTALVTITIAAGDSLNDDTFHIERSGTDRVSFELEIFENDECGAGCEGLTAATNPSEGTLSYRSPSFSNPRARFRFQLSAGDHTANTPLTFTYSTDGSTPTATVTLNFFEPSDILANETIYIQRSGTEAVEVVIDVTDNDLCDADCESISVETNPTVGTAVANTTGDDAGKITYSLADGATLTNNTETFQYTTAGANANATVTIIVGTATADALVDYIRRYTREGTPELVRNLNVTRDDVCVSSCAGVRLILQPNTGSAEVQSNGRIRYEISAGQSATDVSFTYTTTSAAAGHSATVRLLFEDPRYVLRAGGFGF